MISFLRDIFHRFEAVTLASLLIIAAAIWAFGALASEMIEGDLEAFDRTILMALRNPTDLSDPIGPRAVEVMMRDLTALGGITVLSILTVSVMLFLALKGNRRSAGIVAVAIVGGQGLSHLSKMLFSRPRPDLVPHGVEVATASFPSGHSMMSAVTYLTLAVMLARVEPRRKIKVLYVALAVYLTAAVGCSRVYLGVHWPSDVLAGWAAGAGWALAWLMLASWLASKGEIEPDRKAA